MIWTFSALLLLLSLGCPAWAVDVNVYGPVQFTKMKGSPVPVQKTVTVTNPAASYRLHIVNGGLQDSTESGAYVSSALIYWNVNRVAAPANFNQQISTLTLPVTALSINTLTVELRGTADSSITVQLGRGNQQPIADAGSDQTLYVGDVSKLDGSASTDSDGDALSYRWRLAERPANSLAQLNSTVQLDGGLSHDVDGNALSYRWSLTEKPITSSAVLIDDQLQQCRLAIDKPGHYVAQLIVNDGTLDSAADRVAIDTQNSRPTADAGPDQTGKTVGVPVELDGSLSADADGDALAYR